ncbi:polysaccharide lyase family 8 super-sandwich domain-containing protein [Miniphocaeibacter sp.]|uniref:polysaccharide lyase family 8 super-sandwich domain-containing protein n=1 Tax=Miniphocaeibacter sp. TaxID=3100973 RepID=UPI003BB182EC
MKKICYMILLITVFCLVGSNSVLAESNEDLLLNKKVEYSGVEGGKVSSGDWKYPQFVGESAVDGNDETRWSADKQDVQWLIVDMGEENIISEIVLNFHAESPDYEVLVSSDGVEYKSVLRETKGSSGGQVIKRINLDNLSCRYIKYKQKSMWKHTNGQYYGSSIISFEAYQYSRIPENVVFEKDNIVISKNRKASLEYKIIPENLNISEDQLIWETSDKNIVEVEKGIIYAKNEGEANISLSIKNTNLKAVIKIEVVLAKEEYELMRNRWKIRLIGKDLDSSDIDIKKYKEQISNESEGLWKSLNKNENRQYLWEKIVSDTTSADYTTQFNNIKKLTLGYYEPDSVIYNNPEVKAEILKAIDFMIETKKYNGTYWTGNWWDWQIGSAQPLVDTLILLHDDILKDNPDMLEKFVTPIKKYAYNPNKQWPKYNATGANLTDISISVLGSGILLEEDERVEMVKESVPKVLNLVTKGDGLYLDGSLIQHTFFPYNGSYGNELLKGVGRIQSIIVGTQWEIKDNKISNLFNVVDKGYLQLMPSGRMPAMVSGRSISRAPLKNPFTTELETGKETIANLLLISKFAPEELKDKIYSHVKQWVIDTSEYYNFYENPRDFDALLDLKNIVNDNNIKSREDKNILNIYASMDRVFQKTKNYAAGIAMYSNRIANYEYGNTENKRGWHTADGMLYLYNEDYSQFDEGYWTTIDSYRLPGTTIDVKELPNGHKSSVKSPQSWVGGATNGKIGSIGMFLDKTKEEMILRAKKSWFLLEDQIINLGSEINGTSSSGIETILENRQVDLDKLDLVINGENLIETSKNIDCGWINLKNENVKNNIGYIIPNSSENISIYKDTRTGKYKDINEYFLNDKLYTHDYLTITKKHGLEVVNDSYEYVIIPGKTDKEIENYYKNPIYEVISNDGDVQAIRTNDLLMANVWNVNEKIDYITAKTPMSFIVENEGNNKVKIIISNPSQNNQEVSMEIDMDIEKVISKDENIRLEDNLITLDSTGLLGASREIVIQIKSTVDKTKLENKVKEVEKIDTSKYTAETVKALNDVLAEAKEVLAKDNATQKEVDNALAKLEKARKALKIKDDKPTPSPTDPTTPTDSTEPTEPTEPIGVKTSRIAGVDRYTTALEISKKYFETSENVVVASGEISIDSLSAQILSDELNAPILLVRKESLPNGITEEIARLKSKNIIIVGGNNTVGNKVFNKLEEDYNVKRIAGVDRYETAALVAKEYFEISENSKSIIVANGYKYPDVLSSSSLSIKEQSPILLVKEQEITKVTNNFIKEFGIDKVTVIGGNASVGNGALNELPKGYGIIAGADRYETAVKIADKAYPKTKEVLMASGEIEVDALVAGSITGKVEKPILLTKKNIMPKPIQEYIKGNAIEHITIIGGQATVNDSQFK